MEITEVDGIKLRLTQQQGEALCGFIAELTDQPTLEAMLITSENGLIQSVRPRTGVSMNYFYFLINLMVEQRMVMMDELLKKNGILE
jgi:hypothetical protein